jgi:hypothetical protein
MNAIRQVSGLLGRAWSTAVLLLLFGCGGGGDGDDTTSTTQGVISGTAAKGPVSGGTVTAYAIGNGAAGGQIASAITDAQGNFSLSVGSYSGPVMLQLSGGTYADEATGTTMTMATGDVMTAVIPTMSAGTTVSGIQMTPLTSMAQTMAQHMTGGMTDANISAANTAVGNHFMVSDILHTPPMNPLVTGSGATATQDMKHYGMAVAAMSQSAKNLNMPVSSAFVMAMMNDASDGVMNGRMGGSQIHHPAHGGGGMMQPNAGTSGLASAMTDFMNSGMNRSGLTPADMSALIDKLSSSGGQF